MISIKEIKLGITYYDDYEMNKLKNLTFLLHNIV